MVSDDKILKSRIMNKTRTSKYRDFKTAFKINGDILTRTLLPKEVRIDTTKVSLSKIVKIILSHLE